MPAPVVYHPDYFADFGVHVFPTEKFRLVLEGIRARVDHLDEHKAARATREMVARVHTAEYLDDLDGLRRTERTLFSELPLTRQIVDAYYLMAGGTCLASELALEHGSAMNIGGGFHHAFADRAEGFCYINDVAVAARAVQNGSGVERVAVIDTDLHQGNGTARIFQGDPSVFTFSMHQEHLYPQKERSDLDIGLEVETGDETYLAQLERALEHIFGSFQPHFVIYVGGVDPYSGDLLGSLEISKQGMQSRDSMVFRYCREHGVPVVTVLAGGYAADLRDTVQMHINTYLALRNSGA